MATGTEPLSAAGLAAALGVDATGAEGDAPVSVGNLAAVLGRISSVKLFEGQPSTSVTLSQDPSQFDGLLIFIGNNARPRYALGMLDSYYFDNGNMLLPFGGILTSIEFPNAYVNCSGNTLTFRFVGSFTGYAMTSVYGMKL